jgi:hypothetical protein
VNPTFRRLQWRGVRLGMAVLSALALVACGGDDDDPVTVTAQPDAVTLDWRAPVDVDVLANDSASRGTLTLQSVDAPAHGTAVIEGNRVRYTPAPGYFGTDRLTYTVASEDGSRTASAALDLTVQARLAISGTITDAPLANAAVALRVGEQTLELTADEQGRYAAEVVNADPSAWVQVSGSSPDGRVKLVSVVGPLNAVAAAADAEDGAVDAAALPALDATHWTTAAAALMARANGGAIPDTSEALAAARAAVDPQAQLNLATAVRLVADAGVPLPEGSADTLALLLDEAATNAFIEAQADFASVRAEVAAEPQPTQRVALVVDSLRRLMFTLANPVQGGGGIVDLNPDGTALLHDYNGTGAGRWTWQDGLLSVTLDSPIVLESFPTWTDPATGISQQLRAEFRTLGLRARLIGGDWSMGVAELDTQMTYVFTEGPPAGQTVDGFVDTDQGYPLSLRDVGARIGISADELTDGVRIAGLPVGESVVSASGSREDVVRLAADGTARLELSAKDATWALADGWLALSFDGTTRRYTRVSRDPLTGVEVWAVEGRFDGVDGRVTEATAGIVDPTLAFTPDNAARQWRGEGFYRADPQLYAGNVLNLYADGTGSGSPPYTLWRIRADGALELVRSRNNVDYLRHWIPISRTGNNWLVLEVVDFGYAGGNIEWRVNWYSDQGPAVR